MTYSSIRFARLAALSLLLLTAGCTINTYNSSDPSSSGGEEPKEDKPKKKKKKKKPAEEQAEAPRPNKDEPSKPKPKPEKEKPKPEKEKPKPQKPPEEQKPASKPDKPKDEPVVQKPDDKPEPPKEEKPVPPVPAPQPEHSKIVLPIKVAIDALEKEIDGLVPKTDAKDWTQITKDDESPKAELKYELWRDPIKLEVEGHTFHITVPIRYAANIRAQAKNPLNKDWFWIAKDESWGTKAEPQRLTAHFEARLDVEEDWNVDADLKLVKLEHGTPPTGEICKTVAVKVCVDKASIADEVREGINKRLEPKLKKALENVNTKVSRALDVQKRAGSAWMQIQKPAELPFMKDTWLVMRPTAVGVSSPVKDGSDVRVDVAIEAKLSVETGKKPKITPAPLLKVSKVGGEPGFHIAVDLKIPRASLNASLEKALKGLPVRAKKDAKLSVVRAQLIASADEKHPHRMTLKVAFGESAADEVELHGDLEYDAARQRLFLDDLDFHAAARSAAGKLADIDWTELEKLVASKARWDLADEAGPMKATIQAAANYTLRGQGELRGELKELDVRKVEIKPDVVEAQVVVGGALELEVKKR